MDSASINTSMEPRRGKVRGNRDSTLPIEDWAKGLSRAFSKKKKNPPAKLQHRVNLGTIPDNTTAAPAVAHSTTISSSPPTTSYTQPVQRLNTASEPNGQIESWMNTLPQRKPAPQARNPLRVSTYGRPSTSRSFVTTSSGSEPSPLDSSSIPTDWSSDFERELPSLNPFYTKQLEEVVDIQDTARSSSISAQSVKIALPPSTRASRDDLALTAAALGVSLRTLFFPGSDAKERPRTVSVNSSNISSQTRSLSTVSSIESFTTANDSNACLDEDTNDNKNDAKNDDTGIDEDYTPKEDIDEDEEHPHVFSQALLEPKTPQDIIVELQEENQISDAAKHQDAGTLEDVLVQVAFSSPYVSSESNINIQEIYKQDSLHEVESSLETNLKSNSVKNESLLVNDSLASPISNSNGPVRPSQRVRPMRHYKMINGIIVQYDPWRFSGQFASSHCASPRERNFHQSGGFVPAGNRWNYTGASTAVTV